MLDVFVFMFRVDPLNQMINPLPSSKASLARCPESWPVVSLPPQKLGPLHGLLEVPQYREGMG